MKFSSQVIALSIALAATATTLSPSSVEASTSRNLVRNRKSNRSVIKVDSPKSFSLEETVQIDDAELVRALMGTNGGDMSMSMPSGGGGSDDSTSTDSGDTTPPGSPTDSGGSDGSTPTDSGDTASAESPSDSGGSDGSTPTDPDDGDVVDPLFPTPADPTAPVPVPSPSVLPPPTPLEAPTGEIVATESPTSSASRQNIALIATLTIALTIAPLIA